MNEKISKFIQEETERDLQRALNMNKVFNAMFGPVVNAPGEVERSQSSGRTVGEEAQP